eukprot:GEZU01023736.1.p1 GENE.GEZU01023736.1~~GEZU01023736.1.p1  ORF type:complete len:114 (-),score=36.96 GEZU01023736.1:175-516(-)
MKFAKDARSRYNEARLLVDGQTSTVNGLKDKPKTNEEQKQKAQAKLEEYTKEKEEAYSSVTSKMSMIVDKRDKEYVASLCKFMEDLHNYYKECYEVTKELEPHIEKLKWQAQE